MPVIKVFDNANSPIKNILMVQQCFGEEFDYFIKGIVIDLKHLSQYCPRMDIEFRVTIGELSRESILKDLVRGILWQDDFAFISPSVLISSDYLKDILDKVVAYVSLEYPEYQQDRDKSAKKCEAVEFFIRQMLATRLYKEFTVRNIEFPFKIISEDDAQNDFMSLQALLTKPKGRINRRRVPRGAPIQPKLGESLYLRIDNEEMLPDGYDLNLPKVMQGRKASDRFTQAMRLKTVRVSSAGYLSPIEIWKHHSLISIMSGLLAVFLTEKRKQKDADFTFYSNKLVSRIVKGSGATQFYPAYVGMLLNFIHNRYGNYVVQNYLDLCSGWGERLIGAYAANVLGLKRYIGTDPNDELAPAYQQMMQCHAPPDFETIIYSQKMEDLTPKQLAPAGEKSQLMMTSPPYFNLERYPGNGQSYLVYPEYDTWKNRFLYELIIQAMSGVELGGFIILYIGDCGDYPINSDLLDYIRGDDRLVYQGYFPSSLPKTKMHVTRFTGKRVSPHDSLDLSGGYDPRIFKPKRQKQDQRSLSKQLLTQGNN